jgi:peptidoglycan L-alanyl-D-glutamate endopeptidase CwlK
MTTLWSKPDVNEADLESYANICGYDGGTTENTRQANGKYTVVCRTGAPRPAISAPAPTTLRTPSAAVNANRRADLEALHPVVRRKVKAVQKKLDAAGIPMKVFETFRSPHRQAKLFARGRTAPGSRVTNARAWESYHQYGMAADFVRFENGKWNWNTRTVAERAQWDQFHDIARAEGLEPLSWEKPHVQLVGHSLTRLMNGDYPEGADDSWAANLTEAIAGWSDPGAPPFPDDAERPPMHPVTPGPTSTNDWHAVNGGDAWAYDKGGVYTRKPNGDLKVWRTAGAPITVQEVLAQMGDAIRAASRKYDVAPELIVMTIATETAAFRRVGFTGPDTFHWEQGYTVGATGDPQLDGKEKGDYSAGPMQVLSDTARWMNNVYDLRYNNATDFAFFKNKPNPKTDHIGLYDVDICIDVGAAYIRHNMARTGDNPLLVAAAYNAGGIYPSSQNHWRIRSHGTHLDRAAEWYGDACFVLYG